MNDTTAPANSNAGTVVELDTAGFENAISGHPLALVDFWAPWCAPCRAFAPVFAAAAARHPDILFAKVNTDASVKRLGKGDDRPVNPLEDRMAVLAALAAVDLVVPFDDDTPRALIVACQPDVLVKGGDYTAATTVGAAEVHARGGRFVAIPFAFDRSTTALLKRLRH